MRSAQVSKTLSRAAPRRSERLRQRRIAKLSESTTAVTGSKRSYVDEDTGVTFSVKRIKLIVKEEVTVDATVEAPDVVLEETVVLPILTDAAESKNSELEISVDGDETAADVMDVDPHPLPVFSRLVYSPSPLAMSVVLDEALEPRYTAVLSTNACRAEPSLDKRHKTRKCGVWTSNHSMELRRYGEREAERILEMKIQAELNDCLFADEAFF